eukprot:scaffold21855_cov140-Isochrysis_galbana.AAC.1
MGAPSRQHTRQHSRPRRCHFPQIHTLEDYLTTENGVKWGRDHESITFTLDDKRKRTVNATLFLNSWDDIIRAIPDWCVTLMKIPSWQPNRHALDNSSPRDKDPDFAITSPDGLWFLAYPWGFCQGTRDWRGRVKALNYTPCTPPAQCELAAKWGTNYIESKRCSFPVAEEFSFNGGDTPLDQLTVKKLTYLISARLRKPPS